jgi:hypothetical protein
MSATESATANQTNAWKQQTDREVLLSRGTQVRTHTR